MDDKLRPFRVRVPQGELDDLRERLLTNVTLYWLTGMANSSWFGPRRSEADLTGCTPRQLA
jgi:hypothetical protein